MATCLCESPDADRHAPHGLEIRRATGLRCKGERARLGASSIAYEKITFLAAETLGKQLQSSTTAKAKPSDFVQIDVAKTGASASAARPALAARRGPGIAY